MDNLRVLIAPSGLKESLGPDEAATCIENGIRRVVTGNSTTVQRIAIHDGGEGFCHAMVAARGGLVRSIDVTGPVGEKITSFYGVIGPDRKTAVLDMASAAGLRLVPRNCRDPTTTTSFGVGELMKAALDEGCTKLIIGCGDSGTSDGGAGMLQALGARFLDSEEKELPLAAGGASLLRLGRICLRNLHPRLRRADLGTPGVDIEAICNTENLLCGEKGVSRVYGPQKGATPQQVEILSQAMNTLAKVMQPIVGYDMSKTPGAGASGGLGAGLLLLGSQLKARSDAIDDYFHLQEILDQKWDIIFTAEGAIDSQSTKGKIIGELARRAKSQGSYVVALTGKICSDAEMVYGEGISAFASIMDSPLSLNEAIVQTPSLLTNAAERIMRVIQIGLSLNSQVGFQNVDILPPSGSQKQQPLLV